MTSHGHTYDKLFLTEGVGYHREKLISFEMALRDARIAQFNLVRVSSIYPPGAQFISLEEGVDRLTPGEIVHCVLSENATNQADHLIAASVGVALPPDANTHGFLAEHHSFDEEHTEAARHAESMAATMLSTLMNWPGAEDPCYDADHGVWIVGDSVVRSTSVVQATRGKDGLWTSVVAAAVFVP